MNPQGTEIAGSPTRLMRRVARLITPRASWVRPPSVTVSCPIAGAVMGTVGEIRATREASSASTSSTMRPRTFCARRYCAAVMNTP